MDDPDFFVVRHLSDRRTATIFARGVEIRYVWRGKLIELGRSKVGAQVYDPHECELTSFDHQRARELADRTLNPNKRAPTSPVTSNPTCPECGCQIHGESRCPNCERVLA
jgi:hypothetical protein